MVMRESGVVDGEAEGVGSFVERFGGRCFFHLICRT